MDQFALLLRHARSYAATRGLEFDIELMSHVLHMREPEDTPATYWPAGSITDLFATPLLTWEFDAADIATTVRSFVTFLGDTGRLEAGSAATATLTHELHTVLRHQRTRQREHAAVPGAAPVDTTSRHSTRHSPGDNHRAVFSVSSPAAPDEDADSAAGTPLHRPAEADISHDVRNSPFVTTCLALAAWVGDGKPTTERGLLLPEVGKQAYLELSLAQTVPQDASAGQPAGGSWATRQWHSSGDCHALNRLWWPLISSGLLNLADDQALAQLPPQGQDLSSWDDHRLVELAHLLYVAIMRYLNAPTRQAVIGTLFMALIHPDRTVTVDEVAEWFCEYNDLHEAYEAASWIAMEPMECARECLQLAFEELDDLNLWTRRQDTVTLTHLGCDIAIITSGLIEANLISMSDDNA